jgi:hypothetical protein
MYGSAEPFGAGLRDTPRARPWRLPMPRVPDAMSAISHRGRGRARAPGKFIAAREGERRLTQFDDP